MFLTRVYNSFKYLNLNVKKLNFFSLLNMSSEILSPPDCVRGQLKLDKKLFEKTINVPCVEVKTSSTNISDIIKCLKKYLLKLEHFKPIVTNKIGEEEFVTHVYLTPKNVNNWEDISEEDRNKLSEVSVNKNNFLVDKPLTLQYENFPMADILKAVLPAEEEGLASFTKVGHIVHLNLREHLFPYKKIIGEILLDKVHGCKSVVNKINIIDNTYRNFQMELLAGEDNMMTVVKENKCLFEFNFSTVYWNSRLSSEHERIVQMIKVGDVLFDVFAGVGPFSIPIAKKKCLVFANDLNPESFNWLNHNQRINKVDKNYLKTFNKDGRDFILNDIKENLIKYINTHNVHITMNLPAIAVQFLPLFHKLYTKEELPEIKNIPIVYLYCFTKGEDNIALAKAQLLENMDFDITDKIVDMFKVRTVSNFKDMMRITIKLDKDILIGNETNSLKRKHIDEISNEEAGEPWEKIKSSTRPLKSSE